MQNKLFLRIKCNKSKCQNFWDIPYKLLFLQHKSLRFVLSVNPFFLVLLSIDTSSFLIIKYWMNEVIKAAMKKIIVMLKILTENLDIKKPFMRWISEQWNQNSIMNHDTSFWYCFAAIKPSSWRQFRIIVETSPPIYTWD